MTVAAPGAAAATEAFETVGRLADAWGCRSAPWA